MNKVDIVDILLGFITPNSYFDKITYEIWTENIDKNYLNDNEKLLFPYHNEIIEIINPFIHSLPEKYDFERTLKNKLLSLDITKDNFCYDFFNIIYHNDLYYEYMQFRDDYLKSIAIKWCIENEIDFYF